LNELTSSLDRRLPSPRRHLLFVLPAHPIRRAAAIYSFGRCIPSSRRHLFFWPVHPIATLPSLQSAGASHRRAAIFLIGRRIPLPRRNSHLGQRIPSLHRHIYLGRRIIALTYQFFGRRIISPRHHCLSWLAHPIAYFGRRIPSPRRPIIFWPAHCRTALSYLAGVAAPLYHISAGASNRRATIAYLGWRIPSPI
jgi:hypothetical protein